jgi:hypothetical protein
MTRQRAVRKAKLVVVVNDLDDPARGHNRQKRQFEDHYHRLPSGKSLALGKDPGSSRTMRLPCPEPDHRPFEDAIPGPEVDLIVVVSIPRWKPTRESRPDLVVGGFEKRERSEEIIHGAGVCTSSQSHPVTPAFSITTCKRAFHPAVGVESAQRLHIQWARSKTLAARGSADPRAPTSPLPSSGPCRRHEILPLRDHHRSTKLTAQGPREPVANSQLP